MHLWAGSVSTGWTRTSAAQDQACHDIGVVEPCWADAVAENADQDVQAWTGGDILHVGLAIAAATTLGNCDVLTAATGHIDSRLQTVANLVEVRGYHLR